MRYVLLIYAEQEMLPGAPVDPAALDDYWAVDHDARQRGCFVLSEALQSTANATCVRVREGRVLTVDGPVAETKERLAGFYVLDCADLDEAIAYAARIPGARAGTVEVRPAMSFETPPWVGQP